MKKHLNTSLIIITITFVGSLFFSSCSKDSNDSATTSVPLLASTSSYGSDGVLDYVESYQYDKQGRITKMTDSDGSYYSTMEYSGSTIIIKDYTDGKSDGTSTGKLNNKGLCTSVSSEGDNYLDTYEYDSNGYRKSSIYESDSWVHTETYTVSGGNYVTIISEDLTKTTKSATTKEIDHFKKSALFTNLKVRFTPKSRLKSAATDYTDKTDYQFYTDKTNTIDYENMGISFLGKQNKNPVKQETNTSIYGSDTNSHTTTYTYEYDNKGRITKQIADDGYYNVYTYVD